jgi:nucleotide sugar dehydrogenase
MKERIEPIVVPPSASIIEAMEAMEKGKQVDAPTGIIIVVKPGTETVAGVVTDGDIRRAMLSEVDLEQAVSEIMSEDPLVISDASSATEMLQDLHDEITERNDAERKFHHIIVVDEEYNVLDVVTPFELWKRSEVRINSATVIGLGFVGLTFSLMLAESDINVAGIEKDSEVRAMLKSGTPHFHEDGLEPLLNKHIDDKFTVHDDMSKLDNDIYVICVNTPVDEQNEFDSSYLKTAAQQIGRNLSIHDLVIVRSTAVIGTTRNIVIPELEANSGLTAGEDFFVAYAPERTLAGNALKELRTLPQVIGGINHSSADYASKLFRSLSKNTIPVSSPEAAETIKLMSNAFRDLRFSFANEMAKLCSAWGIDTHEVIQAANDGYDRNQIPGPSPGVGGACLTKDPYLLAQSGEAVGCETRLPQVSRQINNDIIDHVVDKMQSFTQPQSDTKFFLMGMAFKGRPETSDMRNSPSVEISRKLDKPMNEIVVYDPVIEQSRLSAVGDTVVDQIELGFRDADAVAILTNHRSFEKLNVYNLAKTMSDTSLLFDPWNVLDTTEVESLPNVTYDRFSGTNPVSNPAYR